MTEATVGRSPACLAVLERPSWRTRALFARRAWLRRPSPSTADLEKKKKTFLYRRNQQPPSCRGSELGFRSNTGFYVEIEHPYRDMTTSSPRKRHLNIASETFCAKKRELDRWSSGKKAPYIWFPLQSAAIQPLSPSGSSIVYRGPAESWPWLSKQFAKIRHFYAIVHFCGASRDCCMKKFDVTKNGHLEHLEITTFPRECSNSPDFIGLSFWSSIFTWGIFYFGVFNDDNVGVGCWIIMGWMAVAKRGAIASLLKDSRSKE